MVKIQKNPWEWRENIPWIDSGVVWKVWKERVSISARVGGALLALSLATWPTIAWPKTQVADAGKSIEASMVAKQTELEKSWYWDYATIVNESLGANDKKVVAFITKECEAYLRTIPEENRKKVARKIVANLEDILWNAKGEKMPSQSSVDFFSENMPQMIIEFAAFPDKYPNLASLWRLAIADKKLGDADKKLGDADKKLGDANKKLGDANKKLGDADRKLRKATEDLERARWLNQKLWGKW